MTRPIEQGQEWSRLLRDAGAEPVAFPTIVVGPPSSWKSLDGALRRLSGFQWMVFTSAAAAMNTLSRISDLKSLNGVKVAAVGRHTASVLEQSGVVVDLVPPEGKHQNGQGLAQALASSSPGAKILFPQAIGGRPELKDLLEKHGCEVEVVAASETRSIDPLPAVPPFDVVTFASPSAFHAFIQGAGFKCLESKTIVVLGETTAEAVRLLGFNPKVAKDPTGESMIHAIYSAITA